MCEVDESTNNIDSPSKEKQRDSSGGSACGSCSQKINLNTKEITYNYLAFVFS